MINRTVPPIKIELVRGNRHQFQAIDSQAGQIVQPIDHPVERVVELFDLKFIDNQVLKLGGAGLRRDPKSTANRIDRLMRSEGLNTGFIIGPLASSMDGGSPTSNGQVNWSIMIRPMWTHP